MLHQKPRSSSPGENKIATQVLLDIPLPQPLVNLICSFNATSYLILSIGLKKEEVSAMAKEGNIEIFFQNMFNTLLKEQNKNIKLNKCGRRSRDMDYEKDNPQVRVHFYIPITSFAKEKLSNGLPLFPGVPDDKTNLEDNNLLNEAFQWFKNELITQTNAATAQTIAKIYIHANSTPDSSAQNFDAELQKTLKLEENFQKNAGEIVNPNYQRDTVLALFDEDKYLEKNITDFAQQAKLFKPSPQAISPMKYLGVAGVTLGVLYLAYSLYCQPEKTREVLFRR